MSAKQSPNVSANRSALSTVNPAHQRPAVPQAAASGVSGWIVDQFTGLRCAFQASGLFPKIAAGDAAWLATNGPEAVSDLGRGLDALAAAVIELEEMQQTEERVYLTPEGLSELRRLYASLEELRSAAVNAVLDAVLVSKSTAVKQP